MRPLVTSKLKEDQSRWRWWEFWEDSLSIIWAQFFTWISILTQLSEGTSLVSHLITRSLLVQPEILKGNRGKSGTHPRGSSGKAVSSGMSGVSSGPSCSARSFVYMLKTKFRKTASVCSATLSSVSGDSGVRSSSRSLRRGVRGGSPGSSGLSPAPPVAPPQLPPPPPLGFKLLAIVFSDSSFKLSKCLRKCLWSSWQIFFFDVINFDEVPGTVSDFCRSVLMGFTECFD